MSTDVADVERSIVDVCKGDVTSRIRASVSRHGVTKSSQAEIEVAVTQISSVAVGVSKAVAAALCGLTSWNGTLFTSASRIVVA